MVWNRAVTSGMITIQEPDYRRIVDAARVCLANAAALAEEAELLQSHGHHARAMALAIASLEEDGKHTQLLGQTTMYDAEFWQSSATRNHETRQHGAKQGRALQSITNVWGLAPALDAAGLGPVPEVAGLREAVEQTNTEIRGRREDALYVDVSSEPPVSPLDEISAEEANRYVLLAKLSASSRRWFVNTDSTVLLDFFEGYREVWLEHGGPDVSDNLADAVGQVTAIREWLDSTFDYERDAAGDFLRLRRL